MTRRHLSLLALGALLIGFLVILLREPAWAARNAAILVGLIAAVLWTLARDFVMGQVPEEDYSALSSWLVAPSRRNTYPVAQIAIVGRQGCARADSRALRDELRAARRALASEGVYVKRTDWEQFADRLDKAPLVLDRGEDDLFRLAVLGQLDRGREHLAARVADLRNGGNEEARALALLLEWMASGAADEAEAERIAEKLDPDATHFESCAPWLLFARPNKRARRLLSQARKEWKKDFAEADEEDSDEDFADHVHRTGAVVELLSVVVAAWDGGDARARLPQAFRTYYEKSVDFYGLIAPVSAAWLETKITGEPRSPREALAQLRAYIPPITPPPDQKAAAAPAIRAIDATLEKLVLGMGLTVREGPGGIWLVAKPQEVSRDFI
ncbi:hypothetical protein [Polyangium fumosum]|uniref:Uncharacterized protein n=1 Tax=Polyangium fumosum TaxID=889272 RepID=A0A4U1J1U6_9BACT|nr:hypothetical protein [Polyangium fumosum]TKD01026.1 hypothetical protein E8A74_32180 [Polyangium fumosum]